MSLPYMPLFPGDYLRDTRHLSTAQHGAYLLLILEYWCKGGLPDDDAQLARIVGMTAAEWRKARPVIQAFFHDGWRHKRIDSELAKAAARSDKARKAAKGRWDDAPNMLGASAEHKPSTTDAMPDDCPPYPYPESKRESDSEKQKPTGSVAGATGAGEDDLFDRFWQAYPRRGKNDSNPKKPAKQLFDRALRKGADPEVLIAAAKRYAEKMRDAAKYGTVWVTQAQTWLNQERWNDDDQDAATASKFFYIRPGSPQWQAWIEYHRARGGDGDKFIIGKMDEAATRGETFGRLSEWPPDHQATAAAA